MPCAPLKIGANQMRTLRCFRFLRPAAPHERSGCCYDFGIAKIGLVATTSPAKQTHVKDDVGPITPSQARAPIWDVFLLSAKSLWY
jgi:hypothetical protein